ncbi:MAG: aryl-sulfate sulfotransferase, partial [Flavobacteriales bacterium]|nr:aryl-sulfate sulfotransferase [Flavobacteriales bacterium]
GGAGGRIEAIQPDQLIAWSIDLSNDSIRQHHDYEQLPNGNVLMIIWELKSMQQALDKGRDSSLISPSGLWVDYVIEYNPTLDSIVWEWHTWDHMIQDHDSSKPNFGNVSNHDELFNLNYSSNGDNPDWQHLNAIDYNDSLDLIMLCSPFWNEIYFIDHSTTNQESASHSGGIYSKGGDVLWRWGNPITYGVGDSSTQKFYGQHDAHWIKNGNPDSGKIIVFNNGKNRGPNPYSSVNIIDQPILQNNEFLKDSAEAYPPSDFHYTYFDTTNLFFYSKILSSADQLPNGNIIINEGVKGHFFEIDELGNIVWNYINPVVQDSIMTQDDSLPGNTSMLFNATFRIRKIVPGHDGLTNLPLMNHGPIELNPYSSSCSLSDITKHQNNFSVYPNPSSSYITISNNLINSYLEIYSLSGGKLFATTFDKETTINTNEFSSGIYIIHLTANNNRNYIKFIKK